MTKNERIEQIERALWLMEYKDHWTPADWAERARLERELNELRGTERLPLLITRTSVCSPNFDTHGSVDKK